MTMNHPTTGATVYVAGVQASTVLFPDADGAIVRERDDLSEGWHPWANLPTTPTASPTLADLMPTLERLAARVAITRHSERHGHDRLADDSHDTINTAADLLEALGVPLPDGAAAATATVAWL